MRRLLLQLLLMLIFISSCSKISDSAVFTSADESENTTIDSHLKATTTPTYSTFIDDISNWQGFADYKRLHSFANYKIEDTDEPILRFAKNLWNVSITQAWDCDYTMGTENPVVLFKHKIKDDIYYLITSPPLVRNLYIFKNSEILNVMNFEPLSEFYSLYIKNSEIIIYTQGGGSWGWKHCFIEYNLETEEVQNVSFDWKTPHPNDEETYNKTFDEINVAQEESQQQQAMLEAYKAELTPITIGNTEYIELYPKDFLTLKTLEAAIVDFIE